LLEYALKKEWQPSGIRQSLHGMVSDKLISSLNGWMNEPQQAVDPGWFLYSNYLNDLAAE
jgi:hypothetical protein